MGSGNTKLKTGGLRGGQKKRKEIAELQHIIKQLGFWTELEVLFYQICDRVEEIEHGWPVVEGLKKAFQAFEKQIQAKGWKRKFVSAPSYHRYQRLKNDLVQAGTKQNSKVNKPTIPKTILNKRDDNEPIQEYSVVVERQLSQAQAEVKALKRQLDRQTNTTQIKEVSVTKLQGELVEFHTSRLEVDRWINKLIDQNNTILKIQTYMKPYSGDGGYDVMEGMMEEVNPLPSVPLGKKNESAEILESTHRWMEFMSEILPEYYEMKTLQSRYTKVKEAVLTFGPIPPPLTERTEYEIDDTPRGKGKKRKKMVEVSAEDEGEGLVRLLQETQERLQEQENAIMSLQEDNEFLRKKLRTGGPLGGEDTGAGPSGRNVIPRPTFSKHDEEERKEIMKRNPRNAEYLDALMTQIKRQKVVTRRIDRLKMNVVKVKLHGGYDENDLAGAMTEKDDGVEFDALMVIETNNRVLEDTIPELENLLMLATVGQKLLESVDTMYTHFCSDILRDNERILAHLGEKEPEADTASNIVTKYRQKLEDIQTTLLRNRDDIVDLQKEKSGLEKKAAELRETKKAMRRLEIKAEKMSSKLVRKTGTDLVREDPDITDVVGFKKGKEKTIWERYKDAYEFEWFDAFDLEKNYLEKPPREGIDTLLHMLKDCFEYCKKEADDQWEEIKKALLWEAKIERDFTEQDTKYLLNLRKNYIGSTDVIENHFREKGMSEEYKKEAVDDKFNPYIRKIVELCWFMVLQDPPMHLHWDIKYADFIDKDMFDNFTLNGRRYDFIVWPAMMLHKDGPLLSKGIIQPIFLD
ncbi:girdin-like isoform X2 [Argopecten irradians]|uniref:girdin-like isoform X2 n=1 Tax=Argopecten irradians TaxID=31199 RepID=UPI00371E4537